MRNLLITVGLWIAKLGGWVPCTKAHLPMDDEILYVRDLVTEIEKRFPRTPGPLKAREAQRALQNVYPEASPKDLNLLIELALQDA